MHAGKVKAMGVTERHGLRHGDGKAMRQREACLN
jgi:hypothetical protein